MNKEKNIEQVIKEKLAAREFSIEPAWMDDLESRLDAFNQSRRKKRFIFWYIIAGTLLIGGLASLFVFGSTTPNNKVATLEQTEGSSLTLKNSTSNILDENNSSSTLNDSKKLNNDELANLSNEATQSVQTSYTTGSSSKKASSEFVIDKNNLKLVPKTSTFDSTSFIHHPINNIYTAPKNNLPNDQQKANELRNHNNIVDSLPKKPVELFNTPLGQLALSNKNDLSDTMLTMSCFRPRKWSVGLTFGSSFISRSFNLPINDNYDLARTTQENGRLNWEAGIEISRKFNRYTLGSGASLTNYGENVQYEPVQTTTTGFVTVIVDVSYWEYDSTFIQGNWIIDDSTWIADYDTIQTLGEIASTDSSVLEANGKTSSMYMEFPIKFGMTLLQKKRLQLGASIGVSLGIRLNQRGNYLLNTGGITPAQFNRFSINTLYGLDLKYLLNERLSLLAQPNIKINHSNHSNLVDTRRKYTTWGVRFGVSMDF